MFSNTIDSGSEIKSSKACLFGYGSFKAPLSVQRILNNAKAFVILLTLVNIVQGITINGLLKVNVTTIERRFNLLSSESGLIISAYDIAGCLVLLPTSYLGGKGHRPRWIGLGLIITSVGIMILALPHFISEPYSYTTTLQEGIETSCHNATNQNNTTDVDCKRDMRNIKYLFMFGQLLIGAGSTPLAALSLTFLDDSVDPSVYPVYIGIYYMGALLGPAIGFILGGSLLKIYTELDIIPTDITVDSPQWVGAWWIGFVICSFFMLFLALPILGYPKVLPSTLRRRGTATQIQELNDNPSLWRFNKKIKFPSTESVENVAMDILKQNQSVDERKKHYASSKDDLNDEETANNFNSDDYESKKKMDLVSSENKEIKAVSLNSNLKSSEIVAMAISKQNQSADERKKHYATSKDDLNDGETASNSHSEDYDSKKQIPLVLSENKNIKETSLKSSLKIQKDNSVNEKDSPVNLKSENSVRKTPEGRVTFVSEEEPYMMVIRFFRYLLVIITDFAFMALSISAALLGILVSGFSTFGAKFVESQFGVSSSEAANFFGYIFIPAATIGLVSGSVVMSGFKLVHRKALQMCIVVSLLGWFAQFAFALYCDDPAVAGVNTVLDMNSRNLTLPESLKHQCNEECSCAFGTFDPICGSDGITYYSSCFAACHSRNTSTAVMTFSNCTCIDDLSQTDSASDTPRTAVVGKCAISCGWFSTILSSFFIVVLTTFMCAIPGADLSLRCFAKEYRSLSVGVQWILIRVMGTIPGPILFGAVIDGTCSLWNVAKRCSTSSRSCIMYYNKFLAFRLLTLSMIVKGLSIIFFVIALLTYVPHGLISSANETAEVSEKKSNMQTAKSTS